VAEGSVHAQQFLTSLRKIKVAVAAIACEATTNQDKIKRAQ